MRRTLLVILAIGLVATGGILWFFQSDTYNPYVEYHWGRFSGSCRVYEEPGSDFGENIAACDFSVPENEIPTFTEIPFPVFQLLCQYPIAAPDGRSHD